MGLKAVANPAAGGQPGSFTTLTVSGAATAASFATTGYDASVYSAKLLLAASSTDNFATFIATNGAGRTYYMGPGVGDGALTTFALYDNNSGTTRWRSTATGFDVTGSISATASVRPQADPDTNWGIDFAQSNTVANCLTIADTATYDLAAGSGLIILHSNTTGSAGVFLAAAGAVTAISDPNAQFSTTVNTAAKINIYYNGSTAYRIQNNTGGAIELFVAGTRTRTNT